jgi:hypothetical protein
MVGESLTSATRGHAIATPHWSDEEIDNPVRADDRNFYKVEKRRRISDHTARHQEHERERAG